MEREAQIYDEKIQTIKKRFFSALDDFKKYYVYYNKNPEVNEFQNYYTNSKGQLQSLNKDLFLTTNNIENSIEVLDSKMKLIALKLEDEKKLNGELLKKIDGLKNTHMGSEILIYNSKEEYNSQYYSNLAMFMGISIVIGLLVASSYKKPISISVKV